MQSQSKEKLTKLYLNYKLEADSSKEKHWDLKRKKFVANQQSFKSRAIWEFFPTLKKAKSDSTEFKRALAIANRCFEKYSSTDAEQTQARKNIGSQALIFLHQTTYSTTV